LQQVRPRIKPATRRIDKYLDIFSFSLLIIFWTYTIISYFDLPAEIPVHYNFQGRADSMGPRETIFLLPGIITLVYILLTVLGRYPHRFNYAVEITEENAPRQYLLATRVLRITKFVIVIFCLYVNYKVINYQLASSTNLGWWFLPAFMISILLPVFYFVYQSMNSRK